MSSCACPLGGHHRPHCYLAPTLSVVGKLKLHPDGEVITVLPGMRRIAQSDPEFTDRVTAAVTKAIDEMSGEIEVVPEVDEVATMRDDLIARVRAEFGDEAADGEVMGQVCGVAAEMMARPWVLR